MAVGWWLGLALLLLVALGAVVAVLGGLGWGVDPTDTEAMATAMVEAHLNSIDPVAARTQAEALSWKTIGDSYLDLYERVVTPTPSRWARA